VIVMTLWKSVLLRWTEETEAEEVCSLAVLEREPQGANANMRPVKWATATSACVAGPPFWPRLRGWFTCSIRQIRRDNGWRPGYHD
jgi:hypothetical protein